MGKGLLTGAFDAERATNLEENDHRRHDPRFQSPQLEINLRFVRSVEQIAERLGWTMAELAIAWVLRRSEVTSAIVGSRSPEQIEQTVLAADRDLDEAVLDEVDRLIHMRKTLLMSVDGVQRARV